MESRTVRIEFGTLLLAAPDPPTPVMRTDLNRYTRLDLRFHLVTPTNLDELISELL
ncbi:MAG: hypothetical protein WKF37_18830 [Bryobacteraceae bacterium]